MTRDLAPAYLALGTAAFAVYFGAGERGTHDSCYYLDLASHLARGDGYVTSAVRFSAPASTQPVSDYAPGFSGAIAVLIALGMPGLSAVRVVVGASFIAYALATHALLRLALPVRGAALAPWAAAALLIQPGTMRALDRALSDLLGAAIALAAAYVLLRRPRTPRQQLTLGALLGAAVLVRWANFNFVLPVLLISTLEGGSLAPRARVLALARTAAPLAALTLPVWVYNLWRTGTAMGVRTLEPKSVWSELLQAFHGSTAWFETAHGWLQPRPLWSLVHAVLGVGLLLLFVSACGSRGRLARAAFWMTTGYLCLMAISSSVFAYDPITDTRFWLLCQPLVATACIGALAAAAWPAWLKRGATVAWLLLAAHAAGLALGNLQAPPSRAHAGRSFFAPRSVDSAVLARAIAQHDAGVCKLTVNDPVTALPRTGTRPVRVLGLLDAQRMAQTLRAAPGALAHEPLCLLIFRDPTMPWTFHGDVQRLYEQVLLLARAGHLRRELLDSSAELWVSFPPAG